MSLLTENIFINGSFDVWLNGTEFTDISSDTEVAGKWSVGPKNNTFVSARKSASVPEGSICEYSLELTAGNEDMFVDLLQRIDSRYAAQMRRFVVLSAMIYNGTASAFNPFVFVSLPQGKTNNPWSDKVLIRTASLQECAPGTWTTVCQTFDLSEGIDLDSGCEFRIRFTPLIRNDQVRVTAVKLESRDMLTPFTRRFYEQELALCKGESYLDTALFDQDNTLLKADTANTPISLVVGENTLVGNTGGGIAALTAAQAMPLWAALPDHYERDQIWAKSGSSNTILLSPHKMTVNINDVGFYLATHKELDLNSAASWANYESDYATAANRNGKDFYIYACDNNGELTTLLSANSTSPDGFDATTSRKIGGFHCLCADVGTIANHPLSGYVTGDILPASVWDLKHRPVCDPAGMTYCDTARLWVDIYLASGTGSSTASVKGAVPTVSRNWMDFVDDLGAVGKRLLTDYEFQLIAAGSNEETNITGSAAPTDGNGVGGRVDTNSRAMISNCGCWECCGYLWQWLLDQSYRYDSATWSWKDLDGDKGSLYSQSSYGDVKLRAGGDWGNGSYCGSRCRVADYFRWSTHAMLGGRGCARSLGA